MKRFLEEGFTLVELMVVVAIIGILSAVAIPNFKKYQAKSKTTEAKMQLASVYSYELTAASDYDTFTSCLGDLGYDPAPRGYYVIGFTGNWRTAEAISAGLTTCGATGFHSPGTAGTLKTYAAAVTSANLPAGTTGTQSTFLAGAAGNLDGATYDQWTIDESKNLKQVSVGY